MAKGSSNTVAPAEQSNQLVRFDDNSENRRASNRRSSSRSSKGPNMDLYVSARMKPEGNKMLIHPNQKNKINWDLWLATLIIYSTITVPYRIGFNVEATGVWFVIDNMVDIFFFLDMVVSVRTAFIKEDGEICWDQYKIASNYLKGWFTIDFLSTFPIDKVAGLAMPAGGDGSTLRAVKLIRVMRLVRLIKLMKLLKITDLLERHEDVIPINPGLLSIASMLVKIVFLAHLLACFWFMTGSEKTDPSEGWVNNYFGFEDTKIRHADSVDASNFCSVITVAGQCTNSWGDYNNTLVTAGFPEPLNPTNSCRPAVDTMTLEHRYTTSLYWAITTMATVGYGDLNTSNATEMAYAVLVMLVGASVFGYTVGMISVLASGLDVRGAELQSKMTDLKDYMLEKELSAELQKRLRRHWGYFYRMKGVFPETEHLDMSASISASMVELKHGGIYELRVKLPKFFGEQRDNYFVATIVPLLKPLFANVGDILFGQGFVGWHLYWILEGRISLKVKGSSGEDIVVKQLHKGDSFGENFVIDSEIHAPDGGGLIGESEGDIHATDGGGLSPVTAEGLKYAELTCVSREDLIKHRIFEEYPEFEEELRTICVELAEEIATAKRSAKVMSGDMVHSISQGSEVGSSPSSSPNSRKLGVVAPIAEKSSAVRQAKETDLSASADATDADEEDLNPSPQELWKEHHLIHPEKDEKVYWDLTVGAFIVFSVIMVPYRLAFQVEPSGGEEVFDIIMDLVFLMDMVLSFRTAFFNERCELVYTIKAIKWQYLKGWFTIDLLSTFPFDRCAALFTKASGPCDQGDGGSAGIRAIKLLRVLRLARLAKLIKLLKNGPLYEKFEDATASMHSAIFSVPALFSLMLFCAHLIGCLWYSCANESFTEVKILPDSCPPVAPEFKQDNSWLCNYKHGAPCDCAPGVDSSDERYLLSFYWALTTMTTVGYGDIAAEQHSDLEMCVAMFSMLFGTTTFAFVIGEVLMVVLHFDPSATMEKEQKERLKAFQTEKHMVKEFKKIVLRNLHYQIKVRTVFDTKAIFDTMPEFLFHQLQTNNHEETLLRHTVFQQWNDELVGCFSALMPLLRPILMEEGTTVFTAGQRAMCMYFVEKGTLVCEQESAGSTAGTYEEGSHFASECLFVPKRTQFSMAKTVVTSTACQLLQFSRRDFNDKLRLHCPLLAGRMKTTLQHEINQEDSWIRAANTIANSKLPR